MYASQATISSVKQSKTNVTHLSRRTKQPDRRPSRSLSSLQRWKLIRYYTGPTSCLIVTPCLHRMQVAWRAAVKYYRLIIISDAVYTGCRAATRQIPDSKLLPRSIYDILTQISNDFQRSLCRIQCRQSCRVRCTHGVSLLLFRRCFPLLFFIRHLYLSVVARLMSIMCTDERSPPLLSWVDTPLTADWLQVCFGTRPDSFSKAFWKNAYPTFKVICGLNKWMCWAVSYFFNINFTSRTGNANNMDYLCNWCYVCYHYLQPQKMMVNVQ